MAFYIKRNYVDNGPGIEMINIHYTWTPLGQAPDWEAHRETRPMPAEARAVCKLLRPRSPEPLPLTCI